jgi:sialic acid synthase SpsE
MMCLADGKYEWSPDLVTQRKQTVVDIVALALSRGVDVVVSNTMVTMSEVNVFRDLAQTYNADFAVLRCVDSFGSTHDVPESTLSYMRECFENYPHEVIVRQPRLH